MKSLAKTNNDIDVDKQIALEKKRELMEKLDSIVWDQDDTLQKLVNTYNDAEQHWSWQALQVRLDIIKYVNQLRWIDVTKESKPIQIAVFNYGNKQDLDY